jgi:phage terminase large subunit-like protein
MHIGKFHNKNARGDRLPQRRTMGILACTATACTAAACMAAACTAACVYGGVCAQWNPKWLSEWLPEP